MQVDQDNQTNKYKSQAMISSILHQSSFPTLSLSKKHLLAFIKKEETRCSLLIKFLQKNNKIKHNNCHFVILLIFQIQIQMQTQTQQFFTSEFTQLNHISTPSQHSLSQHELLNDDYHLNEHIQSLISSGLPVFVFQTESHLETYQSEQVLQEKPSYMNERILNYNRKAKSLEELSKKFIEHFEGKGNNIVQLDKITQQLGVQRRRIYDVINILESLNVVTKKGKNLYQWKGLYQALRTINECQKDPKNFQLSNLKKQKSLEYLASGFLQLFFNWKPAISLQEAVKYLMKQMDDSFMKTKIRRLYDIINVFRSLGLLRKVSLESKRPGYQWAGTQYLENLIIKKQFSDQNTGLNELREEEDSQNPEEKLISLTNTKKTMFSPFICPQIVKTSIGNFTALNNTKDRRDSQMERSEQKQRQDAFYGQRFQFPIFRKTTSAFSLVGEKQ